MCGESLPNIVEGELAHVMHASYRFTRVATSTCAAPYIVRVVGGGRWRYGYSLTTTQEAGIRTFSVGLLALITVAAAGFLLRRRRMIAAPSSAAKGGAVEPLYAAGL